MSLVHVRSVNWNLSICNSKIHILDGFTHYISKMELLQFVFTQMYQIWNIYSANQEPHY